MERYLCLLHAASIACATNAHLAPDQPATLGEHLTEVNTQWSVMAPAVLNDARMVRFDTEAARIAEHLHRVQQHLATHAPVGISNAAMTERRSLLDALNTYADRGIFPINTMVPGRRPVFIDDLGTACAVGHLMIVSGHADIAERIHMGTNLAYARDLHRPDVDQWALTHGFTEDELAWIQPTYEFKAQPSPAVIASLALENGDVLVVQRTVRLEQAPHMQVLRNGPSGGTVIGTLPLLSNISTIEFDGRIYIGGVPAGKSKIDLYEWNGSTWIEHGTFAGAGMRHGIQKLHTENGTLHAIGLQQADGRVPEVQLTAAGTWELVERK